MQLVADFPNNVAGGAGIISYPPATLRLLDDFAIDATADASMAPQQTAVGLCYVLDASEGTYCLRVRPGFFSLFDSRGNAGNLTRSAAILPAVNTLRIEVRGAEMRALINQQVV